MASRKPAPAAISLALALLERLAVCRHQLKRAADQLRESCDDEDASRVAQETVDFLVQWLKSFQITARPSAQLQRGGQFVA